MNETPDLSPLLSVRELQVRFRTTPPVTALAGIDIEVAPGGSVALVGESGSGKTVTTLALMGLLPPRTADVRATHWAFDGNDLRNANAATWRRLRGRRMGMVFQDPQSALNPYLRIGRQLAEAFQVAAGLGRSASQKAAIEALVQVELRTPERVLRQYPHELSGGMQQRVMIAMALAGRPDLLLADEPTTALDPPAQMKILSLLHHVRQQRRLALLLVSHELAVVAALADSVLILYAGRVMERGPILSIFEASAHPYTTALLAAVPDPSRARPPRSLRGHGIQAKAAPAGCPYAPRCPLCQPPCQAAVPTLRTLESPSHLAACIAAPDEQRRLRKEWLS